MKPGKKNESTGKLLRRYGNLSFELVAAVLIGAFVGHGMDRWLGTTPWFLLIGFVFGVAAGFLNIYRFIVSEEKEEKKERENP